MAEPEPINVLLVEDNPGDARLVRAYLAEAADTPVRLRHVDNLANALAQIDRMPFHLVLLDLLLPDSLGLDSFRRIHAQRPDVPVVLLTGVEPDLVAIQAVHEGAEDCLFKGRLDGELLVRTIRCALERTGRRRAEAALNQAEHELAIARQIQQRLYPKERPDVPGCEIGGATIPATAVGGDYYDFLPMPDGRLGVAIGDASGHGLGPALLMAEARACLRTLTLTGTDVGAIVTQANQVVCQGHIEEHFITLLLARLDPPSRTLYYTNAGHVSGFVLDRHNRIRAELGSLGLPLGVQFNSSFACGRPVQLQANELLLFTTDGIGEALSPGGRMFGAERALDLVRAHRHEPAQTIVDTLHRHVRDHCLPRDPLDDMTTVILKATP